MARKYTMYNIAYLKEFAQGCNGDCLSTEYKNKDKQKLE